MPAVYDRIGRTYASHRRPDPRIDARLRTALGDARRVLNVGAGTGSYEPEGAIAVEPSRTMIEQRTTDNVVVQAVAGALPFADGSFDAALAVMTVHHWPDVAAGVAELRRVAARTVFLTFDVDLHNAHWVFDYVPEAAALTEACMPPLSLLGSDVEVVEVPWDCVDGMIVSMWRRPEAYLDPTVRASTSGLSLVDQCAVDTGMARLAADLASGAWAERHADLLARESLDVGLRIVTYPPAPC